MKYLKKYEYIDNSNLHDIKVDVSKIKGSDDDVLNTLRELLHNKIVTFYGLSDDKLYYEKVKAKVTKVNFVDGDGRFEFITISKEDNDNYILGFYLLDESEPIIIHELESNANKYNL
jgi:hypothetical protein